MRLAHERGMGEELQEQEVYLLQIHQNPSSRWHREVRTVLSYFNEITKAMGMLAEHPKIVFVGQSVKYPGQRAHASFDLVPMEKRLETPICEDFTIGLCTGMAMNGFIPVCFIPRWDFLLLAANQLVNHLDKIPLFSDFRPKVIIRTAVGADKPLNPGHQHTQNHTAAFRHMLRTIQVFEIEHESCVMKTYEQALKSDRPSIVVEHMSLYG